MRARSPRDQVPQCLVYLIKAFRTEQPFPATALVGDDSHWRADPQSADGTSSARYQLETDELGERRDALTHAMHTMRGLLAKLDAVSDAATEPTPVCVKVDCGFGRLGARVDKGALELLRQISKLPNVVLECVYTHLPFTDAPGLEWAMAGTRAFAQLMGELSEWKRQNERRMHELRLLIQPSTERADV